jgi:hypothetical protein
MITSDVYLCNYGSSSRLGWHAAACLEQYNAGDARRLRAGERTDGSLAVARTRLQALENGGSAYAPAGHIEQALSCVPRCSRLGVTRNHPGKALPPYLVSSCASSAPSQPEKEPPASLWYRSLRCSHSSSLLTVLCSSFCFHLLQSLVLPTDFDSSDFGLDLVRREAFLAASGCSLTYLVAVHPTAAPRLKVFSNLQHLFLLDTGGWLPPRQWWTCPHWVH